MTVDEAIRDLLSVSTDVRAVAVLGPGGGVEGSGPGQAGAGMGVAADALWAAAGAAGCGGSGLDHVVVQDSAGGVAILASRGRRIVALSGPLPAVGLLLFDLRTCLADAFAEEDGP